jgi:sigma-B regulation protein RsbU (phosphoserine phosphatase)
MGRSTAFLRSIPRKSLAIFLLGVFCIFGTFGIASDILDMGRESVLHYVLGVLLAGSFSIVYALCGFILRKDFWKAFLLIFPVHFALMNAMARTLPAAPQLLQMDASDIARLHNRLAFDALAVVAANVLGYGFFLFVFITEGRRYFRVHAEMALAAEIHHVIVPAIDMKLGAFEFYGRSVPSSEVGGDLIDVAGSEENWVAYLADVSGHGVAPGVVMGMVKSAARMLLSSGDDSRHLMSRLNEVLYPLKKPDMFATFCFVAKCGDGLRVGLAGHPAILKFSARTGEITSLEGLNMPLGILADGEFATSEIQIEAGEMFALYTDGFLEAANKTGEEFGIARLEAELQAHGKGPLDVVYRSLQESVARHGAQFDDQSLLLIRRM